MVSTPASFSTTFYHNAKLAICYNETVKQKQSGFTAGELQIFILFQELSYRNPSDFRWSFFFLFVVWLLLSMPGRGDIPGMTLFVTGRPPEKLPCCGPPEIIFLEETDENGSEWLPAAGDVLRNDVGSGRLPALATDPILTRLTFYFNFQCLN